LYNITYSVDGFCEGTVTSRCMPKWRQHSGITL